MAQEESAPIITYYVYLESGVYVELPANAPEWKVKAAAANKFRQLFRQPTETIAMLIEPDEADTGGE